MPGQDPLAPADVTDERGWFDHFADKAQDVAARPVFFISCAALVLAWAVVGPFVNYAHGWVDVIQTAMGLVTFLLIALLENDAWRANKAAQRKLNAIALALAQLMEAEKHDPEHVRQLNAAVGLEKRESTSR